APPPATAAASRPRAPRSRGRERRSGRGPPVARRRAVLERAAPVRGAGARRLGARARRARLDRSANHGDAPGGAGLEELVRVDLAEPTEEVLRRVGLGRAVDGEPLLRARRLAALQALELRLALLARRPLHVPARHHATLSGIGGGRALADTAEKAFGNRTNLQRAIRIRSRDLLTPAGI